MEITAYELAKNPFELIGKDFMLITAEKEGKVNTMTASWGGLGVMWNKNVSYIVLRPSRYTKEFIDYGETYSLSFFDKTYKSELLYLGSVSGRDENKIEKSGLNITHIDNVPCFKEANLTILCRKLLKTDFKEENFIDKQIITDNYPNKDYHALYIGEIIKIKTLSEF